MNSCHFSIPMKNKVKIYPLPSIRRHIFIILKLITCVLQILSIQMNKFQNCFLVIFQIFGSKGNALLCNFSHININSLSFLNSSPAYSTILLNLIPVMNNSCHNLSKNQITNLNFSRSPLEINATEKPIFDVVKNKYESI
jgi:hypothetical protein